MPEKKRSLLAFLNKESGFERVKSLLREAERSRVPLLMNEINVGEVYYVTAKDRSLEQAEVFSRHLDMLPLQAVGNSFDDILEAPRLKARFPISYADAFAIATVNRMNAVVVTGDPEFRRAEHLVTIDWL